MSATRETLEGYLVDIACLRRYARAELVQKARTHSKECATMGHCLESGFGLVGEDGTVSLLDAEATPLVLELLRTHGGEGLRVRAYREMHEESMETTQVEPI